MDFALFSEIGENIESPRSMEDSRVKCDNNVCKEQKEKSQPPRHVYTGGSVNRWKEVAGQHGCCQDM